VKNQITIKQTVFVSRPKEEVWDFTQNYDLRAGWDNAVLETKVLETTPNRIVWLRTKGKTTMSFIYKLDDRPNKTSLVAKDIKSPLIESAGGSWSYEDVEGGTLWTQTNTIEFKKNILLLLLLPLYKSMFASQMKKAMIRAKKLMEKKL
jgi:hypothetical protein